MSQHCELEALYPEMEEATIGQWLVAVGDQVSPGQSIAELITDKVVYEYQSPAEGTVLLVLPPVKSVVPVGTVLAVIGAPGETVPEAGELEAQNRRLAAQREAQVAAVQEAATGSTAPVATPARQGVRATPAARRLARERGVDLAMIQGSGADGMITAEDIPEHG